MILVHHFQLRTFCDSMISCSNLITTVLSLRVSADPPAVEPTFLEIRQGQGRSVTMSCRVLRAYPTRVLTYEWRLGGRLLRAGQFDVQDSTAYTVSSLARDSYGVYNCNIINEAGAGRCSFLVTGRFGRSRCAEATGPTRGRSGLIGTDSIITHSRWIEHGAFIKCLLTPDNSLYHL